MTFAHAARELGIPLDEPAARRLASYRDLILEASERFNLTAVREAGAIEQRHLLESLLFARILTDAGLMPIDCRVLDIGSGAGLPGIPVKIARLDIEIDLLEANAKRCVFLGSVIEALDLEGAQVIEARAEVAAHDPVRRESYDLVLARAVAPLAVLLEYALPFLRIGGHLAATKGSAGTREVDEAAGALEALGGMLLEHLPLELPSAPPQTIVVVEKIAPTPARYPRRIGIPSKRPLS